MLSRFKVRTKLLVMLLPALIGLSIFAGLGVAQRNSDRQTATDSRTITEAAKAAGAYTHELQVERLTLVTAIAAERGSDADITSTWEASDAAAAELEQLAPALAEVPSRGDSDVSPEEAAASYNASPQAISEIRGEFEANRLSANDAYNEYTMVIDRLLDSTSRVLLNVKDTEGTGRSTHWLSAAIEAETRAAAANSAYLTDDVDAEWAIPETISQLDLAWDSLAAFESDATETARGLLAAARESEDVTSTDDLLRSLTTEERITELTMTALEWEGNMLRRQSALHDAELASYDIEVDYMDGRVADTTASRQWFLIGVAVTALVAIGLAAFIANGLIRSLRRLTTAARRMSDEQLPALVDSLQHNEGLTAETRFESIDVDSNDELADVAEAFNALGTATQKVATDQSALLQRGIGDIFVSLARRNQTLLDRQIEFIDRLESNEEDPDQLENLFRLDHLATRMRRNAESLLVLAGAEAPRRRAKDVSVGDVLRVAIGEVEDFARLSLVAVDDAMIAGVAAVDVAHLLSEIMENGTQYSAPEFKVEIIGHLMSSGDYSIVVRDRGVGMSEQQLADANQLLAHPPAVGLSLSRSLGFVVASTLAARHQISVVLALAPAGGLTAEARIPAALVRSVSEYDAEGQAGFVADEPPMPQPTETPEPTTVTPAATPFGEFGDNPFAAASAEDPFEEDADSGLLFDEPARMGTDDYSELDTTLLSPASDGDGAPPVSAAPFGFDTPQPAPPVPPTPRFDEPPAPPLASEPVAPAAMESTPPAAPVDPVVPPVVAESAPVDPVAPPTPAESAPVDPVAPPTPAASAAPVSPSEDAETPQWTVQLSTPGESGDSEPLQSLEGAFQAGLFALLGSDDQPSDNDVPDTTAPPAPPLAAPSRAAEPPPVAPAPAPAAQTPPPAPPTTPAPAAPPTTPAPAAPPTTPAPAAPPVAPVAGATPPNPGPPGALPTRSPGASLQADQEAVTKIAPSTRDRTQVRGALARYRQGLKDGRRQAAPAGETAGGDDQ